MSGYAGEILNRAAAPNPASDEREKRGVWRICLFCAAAGMAGLLLSIVLCAQEGCSSTNLVSGVLGGVLLLYAGMLRLHRADGTPLVTRFWRRVAGAMAVLAVLPLCIMVTGMAIDATRDAKSIDASWVVILGAGFRSADLPALLRNRLDTAREILEEDPGRMAVVSGGQGGNEPTSEAVAMRDYLVAHGIGAERILLEDRSTTTWENMVFTRRLLQQRLGRVPEPLLIVTSSFHLPRAKFLAARAGLTVEGIASQTPPLQVINSYLRECCAFVKSYFLDRP